MSNPPGFQEFMAKAFASVGKPAEPIITPQPRLQQPVMMMPPAKLIRRRRLLEWLGVADRTFSQLIADGKFPAPDVQLTAKLKYWNLATIEAWLESATNGTNEQQYGLRKPEISSKKSAKISRNRRQKTSQNLTPRRRTAAIKGRNQRPKS